MVGDSGQTRHLDNVQSLAGGQSSALMDITKHACNGLDILGSASHKLVKMERNPAPGTERI